MNRQETITDIVAEKRRKACELEDSSYGYGSLSPLKRELIADLRDEADRLDAAWKREKATTEKSSAVGNAAKLREALVRFVRAYEQTDEMANIEATAEAYDLARAALAAPPRNCDVGTADEQTERFVDFTRLCFQSEMVRLAMNWAQMPYEEGGAK